MAKIKNQARTQKGQQVPDFTEDQAREYFEKLRWPNGICCLHCGSINVYKVGGKSHRAGLIECRECREQFTVTVDTIMEDSHLSLSKWAKAFHLMCSSKKGISALQLQRQLGLGSYRTAWFMAHRIREAMRCEPVKGMLKGQVQADETWIGGKFRVGSGENRKSQYENKTAVLALVETGGNVHARPLQTVDASTLRNALAECVDASSQICTDEASYYPLATSVFTGGHQTVNHSIDEYARKRISDDGKTVEIITTNTAECYFALLKRGIHGSFHQVSKKHLHRYCHEFSFRWNGRRLSDSERRDRAVVGAEGKRLYYKSPVAKLDPPLKDGQQPLPF
jgi:transposase-like protein